MCLRIHKRENQVVEIEESTLSRGEVSFSEGGCSYQRFNKNYLTLFVIRQSSSSSSISSNSNDDLNNISDKDNPSSSSLDPALHSNPSVSSAPSFSSVNIIKYLALLISLVISQRMMTVNVGWSLKILWAKIILSFHPLNRFWTWVSRLVKMGKHRKRESLWINFVKSSFERILSFLSTSCLFSIKSVHFKRMKMHRRRTLIVYIGDPEEL